MWQTRWQVLKRIIRNWRGALLAMPSIAGAVIVLRLLGLLQLPELITLDKFFRWRPPEPYDHPIVIVGVYESDLTRFQQWPLSDARLADLITKINAQQPVAIGLDIYRPFPVPPGTQALDTVFQTTPYLIGVEKVLTNSVGDAVAPPPILKTRDQVGAIDILQDSDGRVRRALLSIEKQNNLSYSLPLKLALIYLESKKGITPQPVNEQETAIQLGKALFTPLARNDGSYVRVDARGYQVLLNYWGREPCPPNQRCNFFPIVSVSDVLDGKVPPDLMRDRIVLIGSVAESLKDFFATPFSSSEQTSSTGVEIHAELISQIISAAIDGRSLLRVWADPVEYLWIIFWASIGAILGWTFRWQYWSLVGLMVSGTGLVVGAYLAVLGNWWIPVVPPLIALVGAAILSRLYVLASNLKQSYIQLADYSQSLELKVHERTRDLELEIQERRQAEEALRLAKEQADSANRAKSTFLSKMSHELRTPLNAILGFTQMLNRDMSLASEQRSYLDIISRSGEHLLALINDVLDMSKIEAGKTTLNESTVDLYGTIDALRDMLQLKAASKGLPLILNLAPDLPPYIKTDENKLRQVLINLLGNSIKFTQQGHVVLHVRVEGESATPHPTPNTPTPNTPTLNTLVFEVEDTGAGIAPDELNLLFGSFSQTETGRKSQEGSGLGLSISQQFVQLMGGTIAVRSVLGAGTTFTVTLPLQAVDTSEAMEHQQPRRVIGLAPNQPDYRILVVEDRPENQELLVKLLTTIGFQVRAAANGVEALQQWEIWSPDLIWMDMQMPIMDGYETTRQIRAREALGDRPSSLVDRPSSLVIGHWSFDHKGTKTHRTTDEGQRTIIIAITASAFADEKPVILAAGCDDLVLKPFRENVIFELMAQYLGVCYRYDDEIPDAMPDRASQAFLRSQAIQPNLTITDLAVMPDQWLAELHQAALCTDDELILQLLADIPIPHQAIAEQLRALVNTFRFDQIIQLTTPEN